MRVVQNPQMQIGEVDISHIQFDPKSRDDIPRILRGLQYIYMNVPLREKIFTLLKEKIAPGVNKHTGRPGMTLWATLVCGTLRLDLNIDYDRLLSLVNHYDTIRQMLGHSQFDDTPYHFQTLKDNVSLLTPELLADINQCIVDAGHLLLKKKPGEALRGRCDSFVVETDVHYPTDINLLYDAMRKTISLTAQWCNRLGRSDWRQHQYNIRQLKGLMRSAQNKKRSKARAPEQQEKNAALIVSAHQTYLTTAAHYLTKAQGTLDSLVTQVTLSGPGMNEKDIATKAEIDSFIVHAQRQIDQTTRRVIHGEMIPHEEKIFSVFQPHTEWISKGKAGVPVELGLKVCILEDQYQFILHHQVMEKKTDDQVAVSMVTDTKKRFPTLHACSFDKGFHSPQNHTDLATHLTQVTLPKKGKLSQKAKEQEHTPEFIQARRAHSAVESAINGLEVHGLDICPDHGIDGFKRYVALAIVARNIHRIGDILWAREREQEQKRKRALCRASPFKKAA
jgi:transposase, IS5 family